jgi:Flp pilus assembly protein TadD
VIRDPLETKYYASDEPVQEGMRHFYAGDFGLAQKHFQAAVERTPRDATAWVGLAASYDRLRRFDLADQAYDQALSLSGPTVQIYNNRGYSHLLRGDLGGARRNFLAAYELDPENPTIKNNLVLLSSSAGMVERHRPAY